MSNMSYCRFQNTSSDLKDCQDTLYEQDFELAVMIRNASGSAEKNAIKRLISQCVEIARDCQDADLFDEDLVPTDRFEAL